MRWAAWLLLGVSQAGVLIAGIFAFLALTLMFSVEDWLIFLGGTSVVTMDFLALVLRGWPPTPGTEVALVLTALAVPFLYTMGDSSNKGIVRFSSFVAASGIVLVGFFFLLNVWSVPSTTHLNLRSQGAVANSHPAVGTHTHTPSSKSGTQPPSSSPASTPFSTSEAAPTASVSSKTFRPSENFGWLAAATATGVFLGGIGTLIGAIAVLKRKDNTA